MGIANPIVIATLTFKRLKRSRSLSGTITTHNARPAKMVKLVGRMIVENPARRPNSNHPDIRIQLVDWSASDVAMINISTAPIVTSRVGTSLITRVEYAMKMGERASNHAAIAATTRPHASLAKMTMAATDSI